MLYVYQGAVETEVPHLITKSFNSHQVAAFMNSTIEREYRQDNPTAVTVSPA